MWCGAFDVVVVAFSGTLEGDFGDAVLEDGVVGGGVVADDDLCGGVGLEDDEVVWLCECRLVGLEEVDDLYGLCEGDALCEVYEDTVLCKCGVKGLESVLFVGLTVVVFGDELWVLLACLFHAADGEPLR